MLTFKLTSRAFDNNQPIPARYTSEGANISPPLQWSGAPAETQELALLCEDPDAPFPKSFVHWLIYGIPASVSQLPEGLPTQEEIQFPVLARQGMNTMLKIGFTGPAPPPWHPAHRYVFRLFALRQPLPLKVGVGRTEFLKAIESHVIAEAKLIGLYERKSAPRVRAWLHHGAVVAPAVLGTLAALLTVRGLAKSSKRAA